MLLVILGAGASHGSATVAGTSPPPLADGLLQYRRVAADYPASRPVIDYVERTMASDGLGLEEALERFGALAAGDAERRRQLVAFRFYLCQVIQNVSGAWQNATHGFTRYLRLFNYLREWQAESKERIQVATFNYDWLIEDALSTVIDDWQFTTPDAYITRDDWALYKLHGSFTWSRVGTSRAEHWSNVGATMAEADQLETLDLPIEAEVALNAVNVQAGGRVLFPALAVPMANKTSFECPPTHVEALKSAIPHVQRVLICGWRAAERHMIEILQNVHIRSRLGIVAWGENDVAEIEGRLGDLARHARRALTEPGGMEALTDNLEQQLGGLLGELGRSGRVYTPRGPSRR